MLLVSFSTIADTFDVLSQERLLGFLVADLYL